MSMRKLKRNYYHVVIPKDCESDVKQAGQLAILEAGERTKMYFMPAHWTAQLSGETNVSYIFQVTRLHY